MSQEFACASSGDHAKRVTPPRSSPPIRAAASRSAVSDDTAPLVPAVGLDQAGDPERDHEGQDEALERVLLEGAAADVAEHGRIRGPEKARRDIPGDEAPPWHLEHPTR